MRTLNWYLDEAKERQNIKADRQLSIALGYKPNLVNSYRKYKAAPTPETMVKLAELAGVPAAIALADLGYWTNFDTRAAPAYEQIASIVAKAMKYASVGLIGSALLTSVFSTDLTKKAEASDAVEVRQEDTREIYIMGNICALCVAVFHITSTWFTQN